LPAGVLRRPTPRPASLSAQVATPAAPRTIASDERLAAAAGLAVGDTVRLAATAGSPGDLVRIASITRRGADPSEVARNEFKVRLHLDHLQSLTGSGDRVGRFAVRSRGAPSGDAATPDQVAAAINQSAFGFRAYPASAVAVETSSTFRVVNRFHRAIGVITIVASAIFLLCITLLKVDERRRDVGALRLIGCSRATVLRAIVLEATLVALIGSILGAALGWAASAIVNWYYQGVYQTPLRFTLVTPGIVGFAVALSLVLGVVSGILAGRRLVRTAPQELVGR
ncbi:MAG: ABC transporter permease, partial [Gemmatimonadota bacterium]